MEKTFHLLSRTYQKIIRFNLSYVQVFLKEDEEENNFGKRKSGEQGNKGEEQ